jgi:hypothetical protein
VAMLRGAVEGVAVGDVRRADRAEVSLRHHPGHNVLSGQQHGPGPVVEYHPGPWNGDGQGHGFPQSEDLHPEATATASALKMKRAGTPCMCSTASRSSSVETSSSLEIMGAQECVGSTRENLGLVLQIDATAPPTSRGPCVDPNSCATVRSAGMPRLTLFARAAEVTIAWRCPAAAYCKDRQAFARFLDRADMLDPAGGTDIF